MLLLDILLLQKTVQNSKKNSNRKMFQVGFPLPFSLIDLLDLPATVDILRVVLPPSPTIASETVFVSGGTTDWLPFSRWLKSLPTKRALKVFLNWADMPQYMAKFKGKLSMIIKLTSSTVIWVNGRWESPSNWRISMFTNKCIIVAIAIGI